MSLQLDGRVMKHHQLNSLPSGCNLFETGMIETEDECNVFFAGKNCFLSNFAPCGIKYGEHKFSSAEQAFQYSKCLSHNLYSMAARIKNTHDPYEIKRVVRGIECTESWRENEASILGEIVFEKFKQNPQFGTKLINSPYNNFYENTLDKYWGIGLKFDGKVPASQ